MLRQNPEADNSAGAGGVEEIVAGEGVAAVGDKQGTKKVEAKCGNSKGITLELGSSAPVQYGLGPTPHASYISGIDEEDFLCDIMGMSPDLPSIMEGPRVIGTSAFLNFLVEADDGKRSELLPDVTDSPLRPMLTTWGNLPK